VRPNAAAVVEHFQKMSKGLLPKRSGAYKQYGYGMIGSRLSLGGHTVMKPRVDNRPVVVKQMTPAEAGLQQARAELSATAQKQKRVGIKAAVRRRSTHSKSKKPAGQKRKKKSSSSSSSSSSSKHPKNKKKKKKKQKKRQQQQQQQQQKKEEEEDTLEEKRCEGS